MVEKAKNPNKGSITEEDTATLLQRYTPTTLLSLLHEVAHCPEAKIDWNQLVAKTSTGISNAREYQMLWRHLAYREALVDKLDNEAQPLDDDSDLEYEVEAFPAVIAEDSTEAAASVKVLIASGLPSDSRHQNGGTVEAPLTIKLPNGQSTKSHQNSQPTFIRQGMNTAPVSVQQQALPAVAMSAVETAEEGDGDGSASTSAAPRKKRKKWSESEDLELIAAVRKYGEGNWANILRGDFKVVKTPGQLAQRWKNIKKNNRELIERGNASSKLSESQLATRHAMSVFLNMPNITANTIGTAGRNTHSKFAGTNAASTSGLNNATEGKLQPQRGLNLEKPNRMNLLSSTTKSPVFSKKTLTKPNSNSDGLVRATAVAAGARIALPSDAASHLKAAQAKNAVHIMPTAGSSIQSTVPGNISMRASQAATPLSTRLPTAVTPSSTQRGSAKVLPQMSQRTPKDDTSLPKQIKGVSCSLEAEPGCAPPEHVQDGVINGAVNAHDLQVKEDKVDSPKQKAELENSLNDAGNDVDSSNVKTDETGNEAVTGVQAEERQSTKDDAVMCSVVNVGGSDPSAVKSCENPGEKQPDPVSIVTEGCKGNEESKV